MLDADNGWAALSGGQYPNPSYVPGSQIPGEMNEYSTHLGRLAKTTDGGSTWTYLYLTGPAPSILSPTIVCSDAPSAGIGFNSRYFVSMDTGYVRSGDDILKTTDGGNSWTNLYTTNPALQGVQHLQFVTADIGWNSKFKSFYKTTDGGASWIEVTVDSAIYHYHFLDASHGWYLAYDKKSFFKPTDGGNTWTFIHEHASQVLLRIQMVDLNTGWAIGENGIILKTSDGGSTWTAQTSGTTEDLYVLSMLDGNIGWVSGGNGMLLHTSDGGTTWEAQWPGHYVSFTGSNADNLLVQAIHPDTAFAGGGKGILLKTVDGGDDWHVKTAGFLSVCDNYPAGGNQYTYQDLHQVQFSNETTAWIDFRFKTDDEGNWVLFDPDEAGIPLSVSFTHWFATPDTGWIVGQSGLISKTIDGGETWTAQTSGTTEDLQKVVFYNKNIGWASGLNGTLLKTIDGGNTWLPQTTGATSMLRGITIFDPMTVTVLEVSPGNPHTLHGTIDGGATWSVVNSGNIHLFGTAIRYRTNSGVEKSVDDGQTWFKVYQSPSGTSNPSSIYCVDDYNCWAIGTNGVFVVTDDGGLTWTPGTGLTPTTIDFTSIDGAGSRACAVGTNGTLIMGYDLGGTCPSGDFTLASQAEVDAFPANFSHCAQYGYNLIINGANITNLDSLYSLKEVSGNLTIHNNPLLTDISGLDGLLEIGGTLTIEDNAVLAVCEASGICRHLYDNGTATFANNLPGCNTTTEVSGSCKNCPPPGDQNFYSQADVDAYADNYEFCDSIIGNLYISGADIYTLQRLRNLKVVTGNVTITSNASLDYFHGLQKLTKIGGHLHIENTPVQTLLPLANLDSLGGELRITYTDIPNLNGLEGLTEVNDKLTLQYNDQLTNLSGLDNVTAILGDIAITNNDDLTSLTGLEGITTGFGWLRITSNSSLANLTGLNNLDSLVNYGSSAGFLTINDNPSLNDFSALGNLQFIEQSMTIASNPSLASLAGLENLTWLGSMLSISGNSTLTSISPLGNIMNNNNLAGVDISNNAQLVNLNGLEFLEAVPAGNGVYIANNASLSSLTGLENLHQAGNNSGGGITIKNNPVLANLDALGALDTIGNLTIESNASLTNVTGLSNLQLIPYSFFIKNNGALASMDGLQGLTFLGSAEINNNDNLTDMQGLNNLTSVLNYLKIIGNDGLTSLNGLQSMTDCVGLTISDNSNLPNLQGLNGLQFMHHNNGGGDALLISSNNSLLTLSGLESLDTIEIGGINVQSNPMLASLSGLDNLKKVDSAIKIDNNDALTDLTGLGSIDGAFLNISFNDGLTSLAGLSSLCTASGVHIFSNSALPNLAGLENLYEVTGSFSISANHSLVDLTGLDNFSASGNISISSNNLLASLSGLCNVTSITGTVNIDYNPLLAACESPAICNFIANSGTVNLSNNAPGCNTVPEIEVACADNPTGVCGFAFGNVTLTVPPVQSSSFQACDLLGSEVVVPGGLDIIYIGGQGVELMPGFSLPAGSTLEVSIGDCPTPEPCDN